MNILITYDSLKGTTRKMAEQIASILQKEGHETNVNSVEHLDPVESTNYDLLITGGWTSGLFLFLQHPTKRWKNWVSALPALENKKIILFTTYKLSTGSFFKKIKNKLGENAKHVVATLKSKSGELSHEDEQLLRQVINQ